jgi:biotin carboxyl carrier protein
MQWKVKLENTEAQIQIPSYILHDRLFEVNLDGQPYLIKYHQKLNTLSIRKSNEKVFRNVKIKRLRIEKDPESSEFFADIEFLSSSATATSALKSETWIYTPASEQRRKAQAARGATIRSPMTGKVLKVMGKEGAVVKKGEVLLIIEAMKMENKISAPVDGLLVKFAATENSNVNANDLIGQIKPISENKN